MAKGSLKKACAACQAPIYNGFKVCPMFTAKFRHEKDTWVANIKRNHVTSHLFDDAVILVSNITIVLMLG
jgi:hypothetical protein